MEVDNCHFLLSGKTGVEKSTSSKTLSENENIKIGDTMEPQTIDVNSYKCQIDDFKLSIIDTPGYDHTTQNDYNDTIKYLRAHKIIQ
jgi:predicted GTPase